MYTLSSNWLIKQKLIYPPLAFLFEFESANKTRAVVKVGAGVSFCAWEGDEGGETSAGNSYQLSSLSPYQSGSKLVECDMLCGVVESIWGSQQQRRISPLPTASKNFSISRKKRLCLRPTEFDLTVSICYVRDTLPSSFHEWMKGKFSQSENR